jgi:hypothetical protein
MLIVPEWCIASPAVLTITGSDSNVVISCLASILPPVGMHVTAPLSALPVMSGSADHRQSLPYG